MRIGLDPGFARAYAALASAYVVLPGYTAEQGDEQRLLPMAESAARKALSIDPKIGEAHAVLAQMNSERGDLLDAESGFFFAISLEPNEATPHHWYSILLGKVGRLGQALEQARRAHELDPTSAIVASNLAAMYLTLGDYDQALRYAKLSEDLGLSKKQGGVRAAIAMARGDWAEAKELFQQHDGIPAEIRPLTQQLVDAVADPKLRPQVIAAMRALDPKVIPQIELVPSYIELGAIDVAYDLLFEDLARDPRSWASRLDVAIAWGPSGAAFRRDPRFGQAAERMGFVDYWKQYGFPDGCRAGEDTPIVCP